MKRRIAYCLPSLYTPGGMERVLTIKANYFADVLGYDIYIILTDGKDKPIYYDLSPKIHIINLDIDFEELWHLSFIKKIPVYLKKQKSYKKRLTECLCKIKPDITVSMLRREINFINKIKDGSHKIGEIHVNRDNYRNFEKGDSNFIKNIFSKFWINSLIRHLKKLDRFIVLTNEDKAKWIELSNVEVISNPLPFYPEESSTNTTKQVIAVGRYTYQKGFDLLIESWKEVCKKHPDWILRIYGSGDYEEYIKQVQEAGIEENCILEEAVPNIIDKYLESSLFVFSSRYEGFGMVLAEAMACGLPAVSFACPCGPKDIIRDDEDGFLVENGDIKTMTEKICYLIEHNEERIKMGHHAKKNITRFKVENIALMWSDLFENILKQS